MSKRLNVMVSDKLHDRLEQLSEDYGMSKSSIVGFATGQFLDNIFKVREMAYGDEGMMQQAITKIVSQMNVADLEEK